MKGKFLVVLLGLVFCLCFLSVLARGEEQKSQLYLFEEVVVKPSMFSVHEAAIKEMVAFSSEHKYPYPWYAYSTENFEYYYIFPVENLADQDNIMKAWSEVTEKVPEEQLKALLKNYWSTYEYSKWGFFRHRPDLSYIPENQKFKPEEANFIFWRFCYLLPGKESEFENILREYLEMDKEVNKSIGYDAFVGEMGTEMPLYFWTERANNAADIYSDQEEYVTKIGEKGMELWKKLSALLRKLEDKTGWFRPDLSYIPKEK